MLFSLVGINTVLQADPTRPKLVVGIVVDQLRTDYIEYLQGIFGEKGWKKLINEGAFLKDVDFGVPMLDAASATSMIFTGNYPSATGVTASQVFDPKQKRGAAPLHDSNSLGNFTTDTYSPAALRLSTISDEIAIDGMGMSAVYSIAPDAQQAVIMAGHAGNSAFWLDKNTGQWATSTYYKDVPQPMTSRNYGYSVASRIDTMQWRPALPIDRYPGLPAQKRMVPFRHLFPTSDKDVYRMFSSSALANAEVTDLAISYLKDLRLGNRGDAIDMLNIGYTAAPYSYVNDGDSRAELSDTYVRLDSQLARLFDALDQYVGRGNVLVFLSSTGYFDDAAEEDPQYRLPGGDFSMKRALSLLNSFLTAKYGNCDYVEGFFGNHLYLDRTSIEANRLDIDAIIDDSREFLCKMSGVANAYTLREVMGGTSHEMSALRKIIDPKTSGDIFVEFTPGWNVVDDTHFPHHSKPVRQSMVMTPAFIMGPNVNPITIETTVDATALAPTVSGILRIRSPNGVVSRPVSLKNS